MPALAYQNIESNGKFGIYFDADVTGLQFIYSLDKGLSSRGGIKENSRLLNEDDFDLSKFLKFELQRGSDDSAQSE